jgi:Glycine cleavage system T protein (aminomethyltransferase)
VSGPGAAEYLDRIFANRLPEVGRLLLSPILTPKGKLYGDLTLGQPQPGPLRHLRLGRGAEHAPALVREPSTGGRRQLSQPDRRAARLSIAGPKSRELLSRLTREDVSNEALAFRDLRAMSIGGVPAILARVSFTGELGYEIYCAPPYQLALFEAIEREGSDLGLGSSAAGPSCRCGWRRTGGSGPWTTAPTFTAAEAGLDSFIRFNKPVDFIGKAAAAAEKARGSEKRLVTLVGGLRRRRRCQPRRAAVPQGGDCVGYVTSGGYAHFVGKAWPSAMSPRCWPGRREIRGRDPGRTPPGPGPGRAAL